MMPRPLPAAPASAVRRPARRASVALAILLLAGCSGPVRIVKLDQQDAYNWLNRSALTGDRLSETTRTVLRRHNLSQSYAYYPSETIAVLHAEVVGHPDAWSDLFALAELSYATAEKEQSPARYLAAAIYAYAFLFPEPGGERPNPYDPRFRQACDLYNMALTMALSPPGGGEVSARPGGYHLPFGTIDIAMDQDRLEWGGRKLGGFIPTGTTKVIGLRNQYHRPGIGAAVAAQVIRSDSAVRGMQVAPRLRIPASFVLTIPAPRRQLASGSLHGTLAVYDIFDSASVAIDNQPVPIEYDQTAARVISLGQTPILRNEINAFLYGDLLNTSPRLVGLEPHRKGRMPVVLIHGTASSNVRWADMINDLLEDPQIRAHYEFWAFTYASGAPIPYSALTLRDTLRQALAALGGKASDPALGHMVLIGHSQGGLLAKMLVIDPGDALFRKLSKRPLDQLKLDEESRTLLRRGLFPTPMPEVERVIFIATPQRGSYVAAFSAARLVARLVTLPLAVTKAGASIVTGNADALTFDPSRFRVGSIYGMSPGNPFIKALADTPVAPGIHAHSIIAVQGNGPAESGDDGVVKYKSAHIGGVDSELVVRSGHSTQSNPVTIAEVRRILLVQLAADCPALGCAGAVTVAQ
ncbi:esterase/lipase family protein [Rhodopila globiformis]|uniref:esterase/lipase family protein n=1 Tax=Rhodopila globiformis TaxID=1071 RepID=UPI001EFE753F|nr:alpha/beta fold hydrolase [Rhodopila globiformis]